jgi:hypothetical protein
MFYVLHLVVFLPTCRFEGMPVGRPVYTAGPTTTRVHKCPCAKFPGCAGFPRDQGPRAHLESGCTRASSTQGIPELGQLGAWVLRCRVESYKFIGFGDIHGPKPYTFIGFGDLYYKKAKFWDQVWPNFDRKPAQKS